MDGHVEGLLGKVFMPIQAAAAARKTGAVVRALGVAANGKAPLASPHPPQSLLSRAIASQSQCGWPDPKAAQYEDNLCRSLRDPVKQYVA